MDDPVIGTGEVLVDVVATPVLSYADKVFSGARRYLLPTSMVPGCGAIGRVRAVGPGATQLRPGDWVFCDPTVRSRDDGLMPDITLQGWSTRGDSGQKLQRYHRDGALAQQVRVPTGNAAPIGAIDGAEAGRWCAINTLPCHCPRCTELARFLDDPEQRLWVLKAAEHDRSHVEGTIRTAGCDLDTVTDHRGRPYSLVCTKTAASYERRARQRRQDLADLVL